MLRPRGALDRHMQELQDEVLALGSMVDKAIDRAVNALKRRDTDEARHVIEDDLKTNRKRLEIEEKALELIATQQPMAGDLRFVATVLSAVTDLERMGDHAEGIAKIVLMLGDEPPIKKLIDIPRMADKARDMLRRTLEALVARDAEAAKQIADEDDELDALQDQIYRELLTIMLSKPETIQRATYLLWVAHNLERIGDRVTNICERIVFLVTGKMEEMNVSTY
ncbi:MAG: phosphate signaling complex protein PhoU [Chloroflexota bacterium]|nr:MAG: phosphate signaling complex protein PhoU [Chloroflexota bacterium]